MSHLLIVSILQKMLLKKAQDNLKMAKNKIIFIKAVHTKKIDFYRMNQKNTTSGAQRAEVGDYGESGWCQSTRIHKGI